MNSEVAVVAGMLEASGLSPESPSQELAPRLAEIAAGPTYWKKSQGPLELEAYRRRVEGRVAPWQKPAAEWPASDEIKAFLHATQEGSLRFEVGSLAEWSTLTALPQPTGRVSSYLRRWARGDWRWRWPLRFGVLSSGSSAARVAEARGGGHFGNLYSVFETDGSADAELLFVTRDRAGEDFRSAPVVVVTGAVPAELSEEELSALARVGPAGVILCPDTSLSWVERLVIELSHDVPLDLALSWAAPAAVLVADPEFVARTTVRQWGMELSARLKDRGEHILAAELDATLGGRFISEGGEASDGVRFGAAAQEKGVVAELRGGPPRAMAGPPRRAPRPVRAARPKAVGKAAVGPKKAAAPPPERRLQTLVRCAASRGSAPATTKRFVPGREHDIRVRIAAEEVAGAVSAKVPFVSPTPGKPVWLQVSILAGGARTRRKLLLPAAADSRWTSPVRFRVPKEARRFAVHVEVAYQGRVIQSATLQGAPFPLSVDVSEPSGALPDRPGAAASLTIVNGPRGKPTVIDLDADAVQLDEKQIAKAAEGVRQALLQAFVDPPASLAEAAGPLTRLAVRGRTLYNALTGSGDGYHDDAGWIHVNAFAKKDVPVELIYTHRMPSSSASVPVCPEALAGAQDCTAECKHRQDAGVVCPYGFWATSKVLERRRHVPGRTGAQPGAQRVVSPTRSSVVGLSKETDGADPTASKRIRAVLARTTRTSAVAGSWEKLEEEVETHPSLVVLVTHTVEDDENEDLGPALELNGDRREVLRIDEASVNPGRKQPGPVVLALGCDTSDLTAAYTSLVANLHNARAEVVLSSISPIPGKGVADFLELFLPLLKKSLGAAGTHRLGPVLLAARRATIARGDLMALALSATGDADVELRP